MKSLSAGAVTTFTLPARGPFPTVEGPVEPAPVGVVVARVDATDLAAVELQVLAEYNKAATLDDRIDALIARSGDREISVDNAKRLTEQVRSGEEQLRIYRDVLQGNIARISPAVPRELPARYEPS